MRLDIRRFTRERHAGVILVVVVALAVVIAYASLLHVADIKRYYLGGLGDPYALTNPLQFDNVLREYPVVAVMFESPTCPHCERLRPYWHVVETLAQQLSQRLGVNVTVRHVMYSAATDPLFRRYGVEETPTLILFIRGKPVSVKKYEDFGPEFVPDPVAAIREWIVSTVQQHRGMLENPAAGEASVSRGSPTGQNVGTAGMATGVMLAAAFAAGILSTFSPCVLPILLVYATGTAASGRKLGLGSCAACSAAAAAGALAIALVFVAAGGLAATIHNLLLPAVAVTILALGIAMALGVPMEAGSARIARRGLLGFCGVYGILALQCTLPLVAGALLLALGAGSVVTGGLVAAAFAAGLGGSLGAVLYASSRMGAAIANRILAKTELLNRVGGVVMAAAGLYLLLYINGLV